MDTELLKELAELSGLSEDLIRKELLSFLEKKGVDPEEIDMDTLREVLLDYLGEVNSSLLKQIPFAN